MQDTENTLCLTQVFLLIVPWDGTSQASALTVTLKIHAWISLCYSMEYITCMNSCKKKKQSCTVRVLHRPFSTWLTIQGRVVSILWNSVVAASCCWSQSLVSWALQPHWQSTTMGIRTYIQVERRHTWHFLLIINPSYSDAPELETGLSSNILALFIKFLSISCSSQGNV